ncbi:MAG: non-ribosomal peptide synthetase, partial [bacterium]|nr:non-ribosomal peptide synthetase [bacterium]
MSEEEKYHILYDLNDTESFYPENQTIHQWFEEQAEKTPDHIAVAGPKSQITNQFLLTYRELNRRSHQLASLLKTNGVVSNSIAAIKSEPVPEMMIAIIAVLKTGAAYLPVDPEYPEERVNYMLEDSGANVSVSWSDGLVVRRLEASNKPTNQQTVKPTNLSYIIYTSGTTGKPKGVMISHGNLVNYVTWFSTQTVLTNKDRGLLTSSFSFDLGYTSLFPTLLTGGQLHILPKEVYMSAVNLPDYIAMHRISYLKMTPSLFSTIVEEDAFTGNNCPRLRLVVLGGEAIDAGDVEKAFLRFKGISIMNHYGPTEATIGCVAQTIDKNHMEEYKRTPTIGRPIFNTKVFILDKYLRLVPAGIAGELCLSGAGVSKGYIKQETLSAEKFIPNTYMGDQRVSVPYDRVYRTGDLARRLPGGGGYIEFLGRVDQQVKIRGYRVELEEIQNRLLAHDKIKETVVISRDEGNRGNYLCAYYVILDGEGETDRPEPGELRDFLALALPGYMIPSRFIPLETIPLTPNGKIDRHALPLPARERNNQYPTRRDQTEETLAGIWRDVLMRGRDETDELEPIGIHDDFLEIGGNSLRAILMISRIHKRFNVLIPLPELFKNPTIEGLSGYIRAAVNQYPTRRDQTEETLAGIWRDVLMRGR